MKALRTILAALVIMAGTLTASAQSMSITAVRSNARFLTDRMAYTLGIRDPFLIDEIYRINYDYIWGVNSYLDDVAMGYYYDDYMAVCDARDIALRTLLGNAIWNRMAGYSYFYRPIVFANRCWHFSIYDYDRHGRGHFFCSVPRPYHRGYEGGHFFHGMAPRDRRGDLIPPRGYRPGAPRYDRPDAPRGERPGAPRGDNPRFDGGSRGNGRPDGGRMDGGRGDNPRYDGGSRGNGRPDGGRVDGGRGNSPRYDGGSRGSGSAPTRSSGFTMTRSDNNMRSSSRASATPTRTSAQGNSRGGGMVGGGRR